MSKLLAILMMAAWAAVILYLLFAHAMDIDGRMEQLREARSQWPTTPGTVSEVKFHDADPTDDNDYSFATIGFQYKVSGTLETSRQQLNYGTAAQKAQISYRPGQTTTVYYNPTKPESAVIEPSKVDLYEVSRWWEVILRIMAFPSIILGCIVIWGCIVRSKTTQEAA